MENTRQVAPGMTVNNRYWYDDMKEDITRPGTINRFFLTGISEKILLELKKTFFNNWLNVPQKIK